MHIVFLSHYFPPEVNAPASRTFEHCREWVKQGHKVTVITCNPNHPKGSVYPGYQNKIYSKDTVDGIIVVRLWSYITANEGFLKRTLAYISYFVAVTLYIPFSPKADLVISTSPQFFNGLAGYLFGLLKRIPWILEIRDLWPESILAVGAIKNRTVVKVLAWLEHFAYRHCDHIVPVTCAFKDYMVAKGISEDKITVIKNGVDLELYNSTNVCVSNLPSSLRDLQGRFVAAYVGTHGMAHYLETLLEAADLLKDEKGIVFLMVGEGSESEKLRARRDELALDNVIMLGQLPKELMPGVWQVADVSLILLRKLDLFKTVIPSKIFESMAMQKPVILGVDGESKNIIEKSGSGFAIEPQNALELAQKIKLLYENRDLYKQVAGKGRKFVSEFYNRNNLAIKFLDTIEEVVK